MFELHKSVGWTNLSALEFLVITKQSMKSRCLKLFQVTTTFAEKCDENSLWALWVQQRGERAATQLLANSSFNGFGMRKGGKGCDFFQNTWLWCRDGVTGVSRPPISGLWKSGTHKVLLLNTFQPNSVWANKSCYVRVLKHELYRSEQSLALKIQLLIISLSLTFPLSPQKLTLLKIRRVSLSVIYTA